MISIYTLVGYGAILVEANHYLHWLVPAFCAIFVLAVGWWLAMRKAVVVKAIDLVDERVAVESDNKLQGE